MYGSMPSLKMSILLYPTQWLLKILSLFLDQEFPGRKLRSSNDTLLNTHLLLQTPCLKLPLPPFPFPLPLRNCCPPQQGCLPGLLSTSLSSQLSQRLHQEALSLSLHLFLPKLTNHICEQANVTPKNLFKRRKKSARNVRNLKVLSTLFLSNKHGNNL